MHEDPRIGAKIGGYTIKAVLGRGGMGVVYLAEQSRPRRLVAVKVIAPELGTDPGFRERFEREADLAAAIEHPNAVPVYEAGETPDGTLFIAMRYIDGTDLRAIINEEGCLAPGRATDLISQIAGALDEAHSVGLVHRDVKPANVLVVSRQGEERAYLTDFGLTKRTTSAGLTATGQWLGTIDYAAPEQIEGKSVDARADVYSLGCVLFEAVAGRVPYDRETDVAKLWAHVNDPPPSLADTGRALPEELAAVIARALAKDPTERFPSAGDLGRAAIAGARGSAPAEPERTVASGDAAEAVTGALPPSAPPTRAAPTEAREPRSRRRWLGLAAGAAATLAAVVAVLAITGVFGGDGGPETIATDTGRQRTGGGGESDRSGGSGGQGGGGGGELVRAGAFTFEVPDMGWSTVATEEPAGDPVGSFRHTELRSPGRRYTLTVDRTPGGAGDPAGSAEVVERDVRGSDGYRRVRWGSSNFGGKPGWEWGFRQTENGAAVEKTDLFFDGGPDAYAVLVTADLSAGGDPKVGRESALDAADTLAPR